MAEAEVEIPQVPRVFPALIPASLPPSYQADAPEDPESK